MMIAHTLPSLHALQIGWQPGIGDPTIWGWLTVALYLLVALSCWFQARTAVSHPTPPFHRRFWLSSATILLLLGINKQLNFLTLFTTLGRTWAYQQQWWQERRPIQAAFIGLVIILILSLFILNIWRLRQSPRRYLLTRIQLLLLIGFVIIRATSLHAVDYYLFTPFAGIHLNWVIELGLLILLLISTGFPATFRTKPDSPSLPIP
ncbi:MAG: hypothetical protein H6658_19800 [Ardenticatenaceae bacterium]|nr:hypothetical protein [Ardenticatenaceae bacterium]